MEQVRELIEMKDNWGDTNVVGERLNFLTQSLSLTTAIYQSNWVDVTKPMKRDLYFLLMRTQKPLMIRGELFSVTLESFAKVN